MLVVLAASGALAPPPARACECDETTLQEKIERADVVFEGDVIARQAPRREIPACPAAPASLAAAEGACVVGRVYEAGRLDARAGVKVCVTEPPGVAATVATDEAGVYRLCGLQPGAYRLTAEGDGLAPKQVALEIKPDEIRSWNFGLDLWRQEELTRFKVRRFFKGDAEPGSAEVDVLQTAPSDCAVPFRARARYVVFARSDGGALQTDVCSGTTYLDAKALARFDALRGASCATVHASAWVLLLVVPVVDARRRRTV
jgi:hypothetical protein